jgi:hypothetical protein
MVPDLRIDGDPKDARQSHRGFFRLGVSGGSFSNTAIRPMHLEVIPMCHQLK